MIQYSRFKSMHLLLLPVAMLTIVLYGCIPSFYTYWSPSAQGGKLSYSAGSGSIAPSNTIEFSFNGLRIQLSGNGTEVGMSVHISKGQSVSFIADEAELHLPAPTKIKFEVSSVDSATLKRLYFRPTDVLTRDLYVADIMFEGPERAQYRITIPAVTINDQVSLLSGITGD